MRELIFNGRYRSVLLPCVEDSNSRMPEVNLAARVGLWLDGQVDDWACRMSADWFCASRSWEWEYPLTGSPHLRYFTSQALLGARVFMSLSGERDRAGNWTRAGTEGTGNFLHLLGKGLIAPPRREQLRSISPVALAIERPTPRFVKHGSNGHHHESWGDDQADGKPWPFDRLDCYWAMSPLPGDGRRHVSLGPHSPLSRQYTDYYTVWLRLLVARRTANGRSLEIALDHQWRYALEGRTSLSA